MKITIEESPYGDKGAVYEGMLGFLNHTKLQLESFRSPRKTKEEAQHLEDDIAGYDEILKSGKEENAQEFMKIKHDDRRSGAWKFKTNLQIVNYIKEQGLWK